MTVVICAKGYPEDKKLIIKNIDKIKLKKDFFYIMLGNKLLKINIFQQGEY